MATLIPAIGACLSRMTAGEKRFAYRLEQKLEDDYLCWYDVSIDERTQCPELDMTNGTESLLAEKMKKAMGVLQAI